ncbi:unnamed protein product [Urochloa humidicola]
MSSATSNPSSLTCLRRNFEDVGWDYGVPVDRNKNVIKCKLCGLLVTGGIYRLKVHIAGISVQVKACKHSKEEDRERCKKAIDDAKQVKKARLTEQQEVRDVVDLVGAPDAEEESENDD